MATNITSETYYSSAKSGWTYKYSSGGASHLYAYVAYKVTTNTSSRTATIQWETGWYQKSCRIVSSAAGNGIGNGTLTRPTAGNINTFWYVKHDQSSSYTRWHYGDAGVNGYGSFTYSYPATGAGTSYSIGSVQNFALSGTYTGQQSVSATISVPAISARTYSFVLYIRNMDANGSYGNAWTWVNTTKSYGSTYDYWGYGNSSGPDNVTYNQVHTSGTVTGTVSQTLYASRRTYTLTYNANGGSGAPASTTQYYQHVFNLSTTVPTRTGYGFVGWATSSTATTRNYEAGASYTMGTDVTLYAVWKPLAADITSVSFNGQTSSYTYTLNSVDVNDFLNNTIDVSFKIYDTGNYYGILLWGYDDSAQTSKHILGGMKSFQDTSGAAAETIITKSFSITDFNIDFTPSGFNLMKISTIGEIQKLWSGIYKNIYLELRTYQKTAPTTSTTPLGVSEKQPFLTFKLGEKYGYKISGLANYNYYHVGVRQWDSEEVITDSVADKTFVPNHTNVVWNSLSLTPIGGDDYVIDGRTASLYLKNKIISNSLLIGSYTLYYADATDTTYVFSIIDSEGNTYTDRWTPNNLLNYFSWSGSWTTASSGVVPLNLVRINEDREVDDDGTYLGLYITSPWGLAFNNNGDLGNQTWIKLYDEDYKLVGVTTKQDITNGNNHWKSGNVYPFWKIENGVVSSSDVYDGLNTDSSYKFYLILEDMFTRTSSYFTDIIDQSYTLLHWHNNGYAIGVGGKVSSTDIAASHEDTEGIWPPQEAQTEGFEKFIKYNIPIMDNQNRMFESQYIVVFHSYENGILTVTVDDGQDETKIYNGTTYETVSYSRDSDTTWTTVADQSTTDDIEGGSD